MIQNRPCCHAYHSILPTFSSKTFTGSGLTFRFLIHFEFIFYNFMYLFMAVMGLHCCADFSLVAASGVLPSRFSAQASHGGGISLLQSIVCRGCGLP